MKMTATIELVDTVIPMSEEGYAKNAGFDHRAHASKRAKGLHVERIYTTAGVHPYDEVEWAKRDILMTNFKDGSVNFRQDGVDFPTFWSVNAANIVVTKYFRGHVKTGNREVSLRQVIDRVVRTYTAAGKQWNYFATAADAQVFEHELTWMLLHQVFAFNSPVWFNVGTDAPQQVSACFILSVDDTMDSILNWYREEGLIFKGGSGAGLNLSRIRSSKELLKSGGTASGPVSFMRGADSSAGTIKSGGATRRAAKMVVLDVDHPDIAEFIETKRREEGKIRVLKEAGYDMGVGGDDMYSVQYQNANNSVRVNDEFMRAVEGGKQFGLRSRGNGEIIEEVNATELFRQMAVAAWECADPGIQYDTIINDWHTTPVTGRINASNPCSEYMSLDNSSCNLASINLLKFLRDDGSFDGVTFMKVAELVITAMDISICFADFPTGPIAKTTREFRQLGIGYANLGALLMAMGHGYDSPGGRGMAAAITSLMTGTAYRRSAELAGVVGPYDGYAVNAKPHARVMDMHLQSSKTIPSQLDEKGHILNALDERSRPVLELADEQWAKNLEIGELNGWRNAQASVLAPTGTIGLMMDCDTTGVEPDFSVVKYKKLVGGGSMTIVNGQVPRALATLGYDQPTAEAIEAYLIEHQGNVVGAPGLDPAHYEVFDCAVGTVRAISWQGHLRMMAAAQPFISGAISKTVNLPETATVEEIEEAYYDGWKLGLKAIAVYRDNCKVGQPLSAKKSDKTVAVDVPGPVIGPIRRKLPSKRPSYTLSFKVGDFKGYLTAAWFENGELGEIFIKGAKQGTILAGLLDAFSIEFSLARQHHVPLELSLSKYIGMSFEPAGMTSDPDLRIATSVLDYLARRLALDFLPFDTRGALNVYSVDERTRYQETGSYRTEETVADEAAPPHQAVAALPVALANGASKGGIGGLFEPLTLNNAPLCSTCGIKMRTAGSCYVCESCGSTSGCS